MEDRTERGTLRKQDTSKNDDTPRIEKMIIAQKKKEKKLYPLRINSKTIIYVQKKNCNKEYAEKKRIKLGLNL